MKKRLTAVFLAAALALSALAGCGSGAGETSAATETETEAGTTGAETAAEATEGETEKTGTVLRIGSLKGPTSMGLVNMMESAEEGETANEYEFTMETQADVLLASMAGGDLDAALIPANAAAVLYQKTKGGVCVVNINTLGVLYIVTGDETVKSISDLKGKTLYLTGKGTTPDYAIQYLIKESGLSEGDVKLEYKSEATEIAALLKADSMAVGLLPQPFATVACAQNEAVRMTIDLTEVWDSLQGEGGSQLVTGVTVVRREFLEENQEAVEILLEEMKASAEASAQDVDHTAELVAEKGIVEKAEIAKKALPYCNITALEGEEMKQALSGYLEVLFEQNPESVGGKLPEADFYYSAGNSSGLSEE